MGLWVALGLTFGVLETVHRNCYTPSHDAASGSRHLFPQGMSSLRNRQGEHRQARTKRGGFTWREIDVDSDAEIRRLYNDEVPVVFINGRKAFKYRMDEQEFLRKLSA